METILIFFVLVLNFAISWWNARAVGLVWVETKVMGGFPRFMSWMGAIMSASGFSWCYMIILLFGAYYAQPAFLEVGEPPILTPEHLAVGFQLGYLIIIPGVLFSGFAIWINSLVVAWRRRDAASIGVAGWNTFAQVHNTYRAMKGMPEAWKSVTGFFGKGGNSKGKGGMLVIILVVLAILGGVLTTWALINKYAGRKDLPARY